MSEKGSLAALRIIFEGRGLGEDSTGKGAIRASLPTWIWLQNSCESLSVVTSIPELLYWDGRHGQDTPPEAQEPAAWSVQLTHKINKVEGKNQLLKVVFWALCGPSVRHAYKVNEKEPMIMGKKAKMIKKKHAESENNLCWASEVSLYAIILLSR